MKNNSKALIGSLSEIEQSLLENPSNVYFASDFQTAIQFSSVPCQVIVVSKTIAKVRSNSNPMFLFKLYTWSQSYQTFIFPVSDFRC